MPAKHHPKKALSGRSEESAAPASKIRGFVCAANFGEYREFATTIRKREPYFAAEFRDGFRVPATVSKIPWKNEGWLGVCGGWVD